VPGSVIVEELAPGVLIYRMVGILDGSFVSQFIAAADEQIAKGRMLDLFFDTERMAASNPDFRRRMTEWHLAIKEHTRSLNVLVQSKVIAMSVAAVNLATGDMLKAYGERAAFEAAQREAIERARAKS